MLDKYTLSTHCVCTTVCIMSSQLTVASFRCKEFYPLVLWIWNQNIAISTIVGTSSHITQMNNKQEGLHGRGRLIIFNTYLILPMHSKVCELEYHE